MSPARHIYFDHIDNVFHKQLGIPHENIFKHK